VAIPLLASREVPSINTIKVKDCNDERMFLILTALAILIYAPLVSKSPGQSI